MKMEEVCSAPEEIEYYFPIGTTVLVACYLWSKKNAQARMRP